AAFSRGPASTCAPRPRAGRPPEERHARGHPDETSLSLRPAGRVLGERGPAVRLGARGSPGLPRPGPVDPALQRGGAERAPPGGRPRLVTWRPVLPAPARKRPSDGAVADARGRALGARHARPLAAARPAAAPRALRSGGAAPDTRRARPRLPRRPVELPRPAELPLALRRAELCELLLSAATRPPATRAAARADDRARLPRDRLSPGGRRRSQPGRPRRPLPGRAGRRRPHRAAGHARLTLLLRPETVAGARHPRRARPAGPRPRRRAGPRRDRRGLRALEPPLSPGGARRGGALPRPERRGFARRAGRVRGVGPTRQRPGPPHHHRRRRGPGAGPARGDGVVGGVLSLTTRRPV